jgi:hypothetical protein
VTAEFPENRRYRLRQGEGTSFAIKVQGKTYPLRIGGVGVGSLGIAAVSLVAPPAICGAPPILRARISLQGRGDVARRRAVRNLAKRPWRGDETAQPAEWISGIAWSGRHDYGSSKRRTRSPPAAVDLDQAFYDQGACRAVSNGSLTPSRPASASRRSSRYQNRRRCNNDREQVAYAFRVRQCRFQPHSASVCRRPKAPRLGLSAWVAFGPMTLMASSY